ncbi:nucleotidyltransferase family protein [Crocosphaera sp.]|uniref:nucleotidyltransferase domain-containing protein n=1 Tax=Crocosphaera sp. TaxID=2729996 RepID=UPI002630291E|nr:nucleotidyltransferase family protein [Crocosphaera sp.]MDJ0581318.1 nucleotidyltransferase family protein [Crocosphaera sp.]
MISSTNFFNHFLSLKIKKSLPEIRLLLAGCSPNFPELLHQNKQELLVKDLNWEFLLNFANYHQLKYLFYHNCKSNNLDIIPSSFLLTLQRDVRINTIRNLKLTQELNKLIKIFKEADLAILPYKGTLLSAALYPDLSVRYCHDIDLLVASEKFESARNILLSLGYQSKSQYKWEESFVHPRTEIEVDLHHQLTPSFFVYDLNFSELWHHKKSIKVAGIELDSLSPEDLLTVLCIQFTKDTWERQGKLIKIFDFAYFLRSYSHLDWQQEFRKLSSLGLKNPFLFCRLMSQQVCFYDLSFETAFPSVIYLYALMIYQHLIQFPPLKSEQKNIVERLIDKMMF